MWGGVVDDTHTYKFTISAGYGLDGYVQINVNLMQDGEEMENPETIIKSINGSWKHIVSGIDYETGDVVTKEHKFTITNNIAFSSVRNLIFGKSFEDVTHRGHGHFSTDDVNAFLDPITETREYPQDADPRVNFHIDTNTITVSLEGTGAVEFKDGRIFEIAIDSN